METRQVGNSDLHFTALGLGTWAMGGGGWEFSWGPQSEADSIATILAALDCGINWIDTAPGYGLGEAERIVGRALHGLREQPMIATKCGFIWSKDEKLWPRLDALSIRREAEESLRRLGVEAIDLYQIHWPDPEERIEEAWRAIQELKRGGVIRYGGVSNFSVAQLRRVGGVDSVASSQSPYSMLRRNLEAELLPWCASNSVGVLTYSPLEKGLLSGRFDAERIRGLPLDDHRRRDPMFQGDFLIAALKVVEALMEVSAELGRPMSQVAIAWILRRPEVTAAIVGGRRPEQVRETAGAPGCALGAAELSRIEGILARYEDWQSGKEGRSPQA